MGDSRHEQCPSGSVEPRFIVRLLCLNGGLIQGSLIQGAIIQGMQMSCYHWQETFCRGFEINRRRQIFKLRGFDSGSYAASSTGSRFLTPSGMGLRVSVACGTRYLDAAPSPSSGLHRVDRSCRHGGSKACCPDSVALARARHNDRGTKYSHFRELYCYYMYT